MTGQATQNIAVALRIMNDARKDLADAARAYADNPDGTNYSVMFKAMFEYQRAQNDHRDLALSIKF